MPKPFTPPVVGSSFFARFGVIPSLASLTAVGLLLPGVGKPPEPKAGPGSAKPEITVEKVPPVSACGTDAAAAWREYLGLPCGKKVEQAKGVRPRFLVITLPDPASRSLAPLTDSFLDSLRLSMRDAGWLPFTNGPITWPSAVGTTTEAKTPPVLKVKDAAGVWLFTSGTGPDAQLLFTLLVGEDPVGGVNRQQLRDAFAQIKLLKKDRVLQSEPVLLLGPTFSGSARSLALGLDEAGKDNRKLMITAASGTASSRSIFPILAARRRAWYQLTTTEPLELAADYIKKHYGDPKMMVLSEAHTLYGSQGTSDKASYDRAFLPRDLSLLRDAYQANSQLYQHFFPSQKMPATTLPVMLSGSRAAAALPVYMGQTMAKSQETTLMALARRLKAEHFRFLGLNLTDRLDALFLARFFSEESPNLRIFLVGSDTLFNVENAKGVLTGVFTFSSYPIGVAGGDRLPLPNDLAAQFGLAAKALLNGSDLCSIKTPFYLSVIGRGGEWPLAVISPGNAALTPEAGSRGPLAGFLICLLIATGIPVLRFFISWLKWPRKLLPASLISAVRRAAPFSVVPDRHGLAKEFGEGEATGDEQTVGGRERKRAFWIIIVSILSLCFLLLSIGVLCLVSKASGQVLLVRIRSLTNGVNPAVPLICLLLSWYAFAWMRVRGRFIDNFSFHALPGTDAFGQTNLAGLNSPAIESSIRDLVRYMQQGFDLRQFLAGSVVVGGCIWLYHLHILSAEVDAFGGHDWVWTVLAALTYTATLNTLWQFCFMWVRLFRVLRKLESHPIRNAFTRLPDRLSWTTIWSVGGLRPTFVSLQLATDYIAVLQQGKPGGYTGLKLNDFQASATVILESTYSANFPDQAEPPNGVPCAIKCLARDCQTIAAEFEKYLAKAWAASRLEGWRGASAEYASGDSKTNALAVVGALRNPRAEAEWFHPRLKLEEEFLALLYSSYIRYVFMQLRNLAGTVTIAVSMLFLAVHSYPFQPHQALMNAATFLFIVMASVFVLVFYQMDIDPLLSRLSDTQAGKLDAGFGLRLLQFGLLPALTYLVSQVPEIGNIFLRTMEVIPGLPR